MPDLQVLLTARGERTHLSLVLEDGVLYLVQNGERVAETSWTERELTAASDAFHALMKELGLD